MSKTLKLIIALVLAAPLVLHFYSRGLFSGATALVAGMCFLNLAVIVFKIVNGEDNKGSTAARNETGSPASETSVPPPAGVEIKRTFPDFVLIAGVLLFLAGIYRFSLDIGTGPDNLVWLAAGALVVVSGEFIYGDSIDRRNIARYAVVLISFLAIIGAIMTGVFIAAGAFDPPQIRFHAAAALGAFFAGCAGAYYGLKYQQSAEGVAIGRELGFSDADSGPTTADGFYDSKGRMNGIEALFNVEQVSEYENTPARFTLEVLCRCANATDVKLQIRPQGLLRGALGVSSLPKLPPVPYWDRYVVRCDQEQAVLKPLAAAMSRDNIFTEDNGFSRLDLSGREFKFVFRLEGNAGTAYVKRVLEAATRLASCFN